jgi:acetyl-CoA C-acetyltransferase
MRQPVLVAGARTPIGRLLGALSDRSAASLGGAAIRAALDRSNIGGHEVDAVVMGNVVQAGVGPNPARLAAARAGVPMRVPATTLNKLCLSGLAAIAQAAQWIAVGQYDTVVAGGMESMSNAPHLLAGARRGFKFGNTQLSDALDEDALMCAFDGVPMGEATERYQAQYRISRVAQDRFAARSHARAATAMKDGSLEAEITPIAVTRRGGDVVIDQDESIRPDTTVERLARLAPAFSEDGTITAGSASPLSDGGCAVVVMSKEHAQRKGIPWLAELGAYGTVAGPDPSLLHQPANAISDALRRDGRLTIDDLDLIEINEAFAGVVIASMRDLGVSAEKVNVNGGAIALGHPVGMSGARLVLTLALELRRRGARIGVASLCGGGGQGDALIVHAPHD